MKKILRKPKILGLVVPLTGMLFILISKDFKINHPFLSFSIFYGAIPGYIFMLIKMRQFEKMQPIKKETHNPDYSNSENNIYNSVSHIEKKTTVTNTTVTTETIYFRENQNNYIESEGK